MADGIREMRLDEFGLMTVAGAAALKACSEKTVQNWVRAGLLAAVVLGTGRGAIFLVRGADVKALVPPPRGRPSDKPAPKKGPKKK